MQFLHRSMPDWAWTGNTARPSVVEIAPDSARPKSPRAAQGHPCRRRSSLRGNWHNASAPGSCHFPVTPFTSALAFDERRYRDNLAWLSGFDVAGLFAAGGTGEFFSLTPGRDRTRCPRGRRRGAAAGFRCSPAPVMAPPSPWKWLRRRSAPAPTELLLLPPYLVVSSRKALRRISRPSAGQRALA